MSELVPTVECAPALRRVLAKGCAHAAADRYASVDDLLKALRQLQVTEEAPTSEPLPSSSPSAHQVLDVLSVAGKKRAEVEAVLGDPMRHESVSPARMGPALKCWYRGGRVEIVFHDGLSDWITINDLEEIAFSPDSLDRFGFPPTEPTARNEHVIRWTNVAGVHEVNLFPGREGKSTYLYVKTRSR